MHDPNKGDQLAILIYLVSISLLVKFYRCYIRIELDMHVQTTYSTHSNMI